MTARLDAPDEVERGELRRQLQLRDGKRCFYCRRNFRQRPARRKTFDHYIPYRLWQGWELQNLVLACRRCNLRKADALPWPLVWLLLQAAAPNPNDYQEAA